MKLKNFIFGAGLLGLLAVITLLVVEHGEDEPFLWSPEFGKMRANLVLHGVRYARQAKDGDAVWDVDADIARFYQDRDVIEFDKVHIVLKDSQPVEIDADMGIYHLEAGDMELFGNVRVYSSQGYVLKTDSLRYIKKEGVVRSPDRAIMEGDNGSRLEGDGFIYYLKEHRLVMKRPVALIPEKEAGV